MEKSNPVSVSSSNEEVSRKPRLRIEEELAMEKVVFDNMRKMADQSYAEFQESRKSTALLQEFVVINHPLPTSSQPPLTLNLVEIKDGNNVPPEKPPDLVKKVLITSNNVSGDSSSSQANSAMFIETQMEGKTFPSLIRDVKKEYHSHFIILMETNILGDRGKKFRDLMGFDSAFVEEAHGFSGGISCL
ncbi:hypothetical protein PIB30_074436 [Stylosanthes scabra]|uniref:Uncharacterized protein n=1 Tax=Stylosanthes scabra TaxID=79078 RepID=A0ABU6SR87_9FABA|nr:hypothetical protein [Stylosanthes scabra]